MHAEDQIKALLTELYALVSGPAGFERDWQRQSELFYPYANMIRTSVDAEGTPQALVMKAQDYPANFRKLMAGEAFYEVEISRVIEVFGNVAHAFSAYEAWRDEGRTEFIKRGINSIQLFNDGQSWKIINMIWDDERADSTMSAKYNPAAAV